MVGGSVGSEVGAGQIDSSVAEHEGAEALHAVAPQHAKGVPPRQAVHDEVSLKSAGPEQPSQCREPVPA
eukprot:CAMPEP_0171986808 /NCGR_PEP_ID=MMETSP0993-20121228/275062_1 /TAXON_ID=483369 /ORGANISM="non described non described, Strain CCMP2098" /LENGTH=68 /DNA_ID=CAMNT_0012639725 /DNA_START=502 /DNA_END=708 /DNA_ORIENTATION=+